MSLNGLVDHKKKEAVYPLDAIMSRQGNKAVDVKYLIIPPNSPKYEEYNGFRRVDIRFVKSLGFLRDIAKIKNRFPKTKVYGATKEVCDVFAKMQDMDKGQEGFIEIIPAKWVEKLEAEAKKEAKAKAEAEKNGAKG